MRPLALETRGCQPETARIPNHTNSRDLHDVSFSLWREGARVSLKTGCKFQAARDTEATSQKCAYGGGWGGGGGAQLVGTGQRRTHALLPTQGGSFSPVSSHPTGVGSRYRADSLHPLSRAGHSQVSPPTKCGWPAKQVVLGLKDRVARAWTTCSDSLTTSGCKGRGVHVRACVYIGNFASHARLAPGISNPGLISNPASSPILATNPNRRESWIDSASDRAERKSSHGAS